MAGILAGGPESIIVGSTAAAAWGMEGGCWSPAEIGSPRQLKLPDWASTRRITTLDRRDTTRVGRLRVTTAGRTLVELAGCPAIGEEAFNVAFDQVLRWGRESLGNLGRRAEKMAEWRLPGSARFAAAVAARDPAAKYHPTELETRLRLFLRRFGFPEAVFQYRVALPLYGAALLDFAWPEWRIGAEGQSARWHFGMPGYERDQARLSELAAQGWIVLLITHKQMKSRPEHVAELVRQAFARREGSAG
jgi:very-short-patch-repair endonuclease